MNCAMQDPSDGSGENPISTYVVENRIKLDDMPLITCQCTLFQPMKGGRSILTIPNHSAAPHDWIFAPSHRATF